MANLTGGQISQQYIHFIEAGRSQNIGSQKLHALAQALDLPVTLLQHILSNNQLPDAPIVARASAGVAIPDQAEEYRTQPVEHVFYPDPLPTEPDFFAVEISGDSMAPKLAHGDLAIVRRHHPDAALLPGHIYLCRIQGRTTCKYLMPQAGGDGYYLSAERPDLFADTPLTPAIQLQGRVVEVRKTHSLTRTILS